MRAAHKNQQQQEAAPMNVFQSLRVDAVTAPETAPALSECVARAVRRYLAHSGGDCAQDLYRLVLAEVEAPLLEAVLKYTRNNQTLAATVLGLNRGTLRKKLKRYGML